MAGNRIQIRRGSGNPENNLLSYELGWDTTNKALYINDGGTSKIAALPLTGGTLSGPVINNFNNSSVGRHLIDLCHNYLGASATGTIKITLPNTTSNMVMMVIRIILYTYNSDSGKELIISGYTYNNSTWYNYQATALGGKMAQAIRLAHDGTHYCILLGATNTTWPYTSVQLADVYSSYGAQPTSGYSISLITSESGYTVTATVGHALVVGNGGTGATSAAGARANLGTWSLISDSYNTLMPADGTTNGWIKFGTSNTSYGILPSTSGGAGSGHNYIGTSSWYWKYAYIDEIYGHLNGPADALNFVHTNELILGNNTSQSRVWFNYRRVKDGATSGNTAITEYRFGNGNAGTSGVTLYADSFTGNATSATNATNATNIVIAGGTGATKVHLIGAINYASGAQSIYVSSPVTVNNSTVYISDKPVVVNGDTTARKIFVTTSASVPSGAVAGDIVLVKA